jgi:hypothetical protein
MPDLPADGSKDVRRLAKSPNYSSLLEVAPAPAATARAPAVPNDSSALSPLTDPFVPARSYAGRSKLRRWEEDSISLASNSDLKRSPLGPCLPD